MKKLIVGAGLVMAGIVGLLGANATDGPGPVPTCNGLTATHVLVAQTENNSPEVVAAAIAPYQEWTDQGVIVVAETDALLRGTTGSDVLVALVSTNSGGIVGGPSNLKSPDKGGPTSGDVMCGKGVPEEGDVNLYYATHWNDVIIDGPGDSDIYAGGCKLEGKGTHGTDDDCDEVFAGGGTDRVWGFIVPDNRVQVIQDGSGWDHNYIGRGHGVVEVFGGASPSTVPGGGDHVHTCPLGSQPTNILMEGIEYVGTEAALNNPAPFDPCAYQPVII